ncbi:type II toxin-antitoxin system RelE/ParE family toxin [Luteolibacter marinus]|uniref:type II toxin-antitoxin system RelE/ParE family toxin n=1 Tax=Luteolibacter marinus TaxID=2776705 RepID=UPI001867DA54|nr:type II toxin-antitoxin system RelE/ParE family toxin [Luteolibacter marinus]
MRLIYHPGAEVELVEAAKYYEFRVPSLGHEFLDAVDQAICGIQNDPERFRVVEADIRRQVLGRFPYSIFYRVLPGEIRILAFKHDARHPDYWRDRLGD